MVSVTKSYTGDEKFAEEFIQRGITAHLAAFKLTLVTFRVLNVRINTMHIEATLQLDDPVHAKSDTLWCGLQNIWSAYSLLTNGVGELTWKVLGEVTSLTAHS